MECPAALTEITMTQEHLVPTKHDPFKAWISPPLQQGLGKQLLQGCGTEQHLLLPL